MNRNGRPLQVSAHKQSWSPSRTTANIIRGCVPVGTITYAPESIEDRVFGDPQRDCKMVAVEEAAGTQ